MNNSDLIKVLGKVAINPCGEFNTKTKYERLDLVTYGDCSYLAKKDTNGELPTNEEFWMLVTKSGKPGDMGFQGSQGSGFQGAQGPQGKIGQQGKIGAQGYCGLQGAKGNEGKQGSGGKNGVQGEIGFQGNRGSQGSKGDEGKQGSQGKIGLQGDEGKQGNRGSQGLKGDGGKQGSKGDQGEKGEQGNTGKQGSGGNQGNQGPQGIIGAKGEQGNQGKIGIGVQGNNGTQGAQGIIGQMGNQGFQGVQGNQGNQGKQGNRGTQGDKGVQGNQGTQGNQGNRGTQGQQGVIGVQGKQGNQGQQGVQGAKGVDGSTGSNGVTGDVWLPVVDKDGRLTWQRKSYNDQDKPGEFMLIQEIEYYGWTKSAEPEITAEYKNNAKSYISQKKPKLLDNITPNSLFDAVSASEEMPYIWKRTNKNKNWECVDAYYVEAKVAEGISSVVIEARQTYGAVCVDTDLSWMVFPSSSTSSGGGTSWTPQDGITFTPSMTINGGGGTDAGSLYMTMERWDRKTKKCELTNKSALEQIYTAIKYSDPVSGFDWGTFKDYYSDSTVPFSPFILKFTNGLFTIQDIHNLSVSNRVLSGIELNGSLTIFNSVNSFMQGSHNQMKKYRVDTGMKIFLKSSGCSMSIGNTTVTTLPNAL